MPNSLIGASRLAKGDQHFFLHSTEIPGIQDIRAQFDVGATFLKYLGVQKCDYLPRSPQVGNFSLSSLLISNVDPFIALTGQTGFNGYIVQNKLSPAQNFSFTSGYLTSYTSRCSIGEVPQINVEIVALGNVGRISSGESAFVSATQGAIRTSKATGVLKIPGPGSISINLDEFNTNRVQSYDLNISVPRNPFYGLGMRQPYAVEINYPIEITASFSMEVDNYTGYTMRNFPAVPRTKNLNIQISDHQTNEPITSYTFDNMLLTNEQYSTDVNSSVNVQLTYKSYRTR